ncbi:MAG TPA: hypothetical protein VGB97_01515 [Candidatus Paceibacterota bacterium]
MSINEPFGANGILGYIQEQIAAIKPEEFVNSLAEPGFDENDVTFVGEADDRIKRLTVFYGKLTAQMEPLLERAQEIHKLGREERTPDVVEEYRRIQETCGDLSRLSEIVAGMVKLEIRIRFRQIPPHHSFVICENWRVGWMRHVLLIQLG